MWPDRVLNPGPLTYESGALPTALHGQIQMTFPIKLLKLFLVKFHIKHLYDGYKRSSLKGHDTRNSRWPWCPYMVKTTQTTSFPEPLEKDVKCQIHGPFELSSYFL